MARSVIASIGLALLASCGSSDQGSDPGGVDTTGKALALPSQVFGIYGQGPTANPNHLGAASLQTFGDFKGTNIVPAFAESYVTASVLTLLSLANEKGIKGTAMDPRLDQAVAGTNVTANLDAVVASYKTAPGMGYYGVIDEPSYQDFSKVAAVVRGLEARDSSHVSWVNLLPDYADAGRLGGSYENYVTQFMAQVSPGVFGFDYYPFLGTGDYQATYFNNLQIVRDASVANGNRSWVVWCQAGGGGDLPGSNTWRVPTQAEMSLQAMSALAYGADGIGWFHYWYGAGFNGTGFTDGLVNGTGTKTARWSQVQAINMQLAAIGRYTSAAVSSRIWHNGSGAIPTGTAHRYSGSPVAVPSLAAPLIVGEFTTGSDNLVLLVNRTVGAMNAELWLNSADATPLLFDVGAGTFAPVAVTARVGMHVRMTATFEPGGARLVYLKGPVATNANRARLASNGVLFLDDFLISDDGRFKFGLQRDGDVVLYQGCTVIWHSGTTSSAPRYVLMQADGDLVASDSGNGIIAKTGTPGNPGAALTVRNDGNVVLTATSGAVLWETHTGGR